MVKYNCLKNYLHSKKNYKFYGFNGVLKAGSPLRCALSRTPLRFTRFKHCCNSRRFGCAAPPQAAKAVPAPTKTTAVAD